MTTAVLLFAATFAVVFTLGLQQLNVTAGHRLAAFVTSFAITGSNLVLFKLLPGPTGVLDIAAHFLGGATGIVASMWAHPHLARRLMRAKAAPRTTEPMEWPPLCAAGHRDEWKVTP